VWLQFVGLGLVSVILNTAVDVLVVLAASRARSVALSRPTLLRRLRTGSGLVIASLGLGLLFARRPA
jgi:threonine/homoserine/homoserine lactone efflux protein